MPMAKAQFKRELEYGVAMVLTREMLERGVIDRREYCRADKMYTDRYQPLFKRRELPDTRQENFGFCPN